ncbi:hypothetical protein L596_019065 [Steinernema carpocapsae]|uniref:GATOR2 complex protein WDR24 n=1 Tax=Steinernema carpocapsae TaxID=34508 RepID=A0A4U5N7M7_STECR|nr:hypothetical protein L596_019065 [Steinernema carpocapsae]
MDALDAISLNGNGRHVVGASRSSIRVYSIINGSVEAVYEHRYPRNKRFAYYSSGCVSWSPVSDDLIASTSLNGAVMLWQPQVGLLERNYRAHSVAATAINFSRHDKNILVSGGKDGSVLAYDLRQKHPIANYKY